MYAWITLLLASPAWAGAQNCWERNKGTGYQAVCKDQTYNGEGQKLDAYVPKVGTGPFPTVILIHGGCFEAGKGSKDDKNTLDQVERLTNAGYAVVTVEYRVAKPHDPSNHYPAALHDVQDAVRWVREFGAKKCRAKPEQTALKTDKLVAFGASAGATLAGYLGTRPITGSRNQTDQYSEPVTGVIDWFGRTQMTKERDSEVHDEFNRDCAEEFMGHRRTPENMKSFRDASILGNIESNPSCFLIEHGDSDHAVNVEHSVLFFNELSNKIHGQPVLHPTQYQYLQPVNAHCTYELDIIPGVDHGFGDKVDEAWKRICPYLEKTLGDSVGTAADLHANSNR
jgi:alpha-L-fucosidase 2